ncbi:hypothetical protein KFL_001410030 [Klebsormidium nitens]|uniref:Uncharacterized protein n=1 Tax=Klebsormidium nitens TaxID=105231 RepID=A0A0U9HJN7_KLENI|nr:hypothetical protein KFL_001410030 [Klebsormidium nitens]|eukprot:GAQ83245.1 hypothetical protein KFL_001410030 [Klebsormidium nitens]
MSSTGSTRKAIDALQMGSLLEEPFPLRRPLESAFSLGRTISTSTEGMDIEFDAVLLDVASYSEAPLVRFQERGPVADKGEVMEWLEAAVFGEDEDFGALLVEPLRARVALGPIYDEIFGNAESGGGLPAMGSPANGVSSEGQVRAENELSGGHFHNAAESLLSREGFAVSSWAREEVSIADADALETILDVIQNVLEETAETADELGVTRGPVTRRGPPSAGDSWAAVVGTLENRAPILGSRKAPQAVQGHPRGGPVLDLVLMDAQPGKGFQRKKAGRQGPAIEAFQEWGPVKEERNPRLRAGKWKSHARRKGSPPPRRMGNFGTGKFCSICSPALSNRLHKKVDARRECKAGDLIPG